MKVELPKTEVSNRFAILESEDEELQASLIATVDEEEE